MLKIENRKNTTKQGLECLKALVESLNEKIMNDIKPLKSSNFPARVSQDNGEQWGGYNYSSWENDEGCWEIEDGELCFVTKHKTEYGEHSGTEVNVSEIFRLDFSACMKALTELIEKYNQASAEKDAELDLFLTTYQAYRGEVVGA